MKKVELLAPAGNYEALTGAIAAGADAVYLGGDAFGARAYADNFTQEEICKGIRFAHLLNKKIYLTVNTLVKEKEFDKLYEFLLPFYEAGLDGVIIQDLGVFSFVKKYFPKLSLHVSTQMTITGAYGAQLITDAGAERIVPARELSLEEIREIKEKVPVEIETFVHGAMCYCYSGQCLLSSILGGRSGNRGRCAQPCRLPYQVNGGKEHYPMSMKDMCTISVLPELIEAGIDSFKIEGRMKRPEYAAGVTAVYRKYIDLYEQDPEHYSVDPEDLEYLKSLYIRSGIMEGYYHKHNGKDMLTLSSPAYSGSDDALLSKIRSTYIEKKIVMPVNACAVFQKGQKARLELSYQDISISVLGAEVQEAQKQPLSEEKIKEQLYKSGNTAFVITTLSLVSEQDIFMPVSALNQLRRDAVKALEDKIIEKNGLLYADRCALPYGEELEQKSKNDLPKKHSQEMLLDEKAANEKDVQLHVLVGNKQQLEAALNSGVQRIYLDRQAIDASVVEELFKWKENSLKEKKNNCSFYLAFPYIVRKKDEKQLNQLYTLLKSPVFDGVLVRNPESISFLEKMQNTKDVVTDTGVYAYNKEALAFWAEHGDEHYLPVELNRHEWKELIEEAHRTEKKVSLTVYGRLPVMLSANCLKKTTDNCKKCAGFVTLTDRYKKDFPVYTDCTYCYNIMYNSVPLSLHKLFAGKEKKPFGIRLDFTVEDQKETLAVIQYFKELTHGCYKEPFYQEFTTGHYKRGVE